MGRPEPPQNVQHNRSCSNLTNPLTACGQKGTEMTHFANRDDAYTAMVQENKRYKLAGNKKDMAVLVDGPDDMFSVMSLKDAVDNEFLYEWSV